MAKDILLTVPETVPGIETEKSSFTFSLFANRLEIGTTITAVVSSRENSSESYREEGQLGFDPPISEAKAVVLRLVGGLSEKMLRKYPEDSPKHGDVVHFISRTRESVENKLHL